MKSYAQLAFNSRCKDITDFIKVVVQKMHKICAKNAFTNKSMLYSVIFLIFLYKRIKFYYFQYKVFFNKNTFLVFFAIYVFITTFALLK